LVAGTEEFGDQGRGHLGDEILNGGVTGAKQVNAQFVQSHHDRLGLALAGVGAGEQPWSSYAATGCSEPRVGPQFQEVHTSSPGAIGVVVHIGDDGGLDLFDQAVNATNVMTATVMTSLRLVDFSSNRRDSLSRE
jgi:hypothetical protein